MNSALISSCVIAGSSSRRSGFVAPPALHVHAVHVTDSVWGRLDGVVKMGAHYLDCPGTLQHTMFGRVRQREEAVRQAGLASCTALTPARFHVATAPGRLWGIASASTAQICESPQPASGTTSRAEPLTSLVTAPAAIT